MPAYNEAECIEEVVSSWLPVAEKLSGLLVVVNDGSRDETGSILDDLAKSAPALKVFHQKNAGHGAAVLHAYRRALEGNAEYVFQTDSDGQFDPQDFWALWEKRDEYGLLMGIRATRNDPWLRKVISRLARVVTLSLFGSSIADANIPFRLYRADVLKAALAKLPEGVFAPNIFLALIVQKSEVRVCQIPVSHHERASGKTSIVGRGLWKACLRTALELWRFRF